MSKPHDALVQSVKARLVQRAHADRLEPNQVLTRFAIERFLYRLSKSHHGNRFLLKGSNLLLVWFGTFVRPTRDADLLGLPEPVQLARGAWRVEEAEAGNALPPPIRRTVKNLE